jgi:hypothetical protein
MDPQSLSDRPTSRPRRALAALVIALGALALAAVPAMGQDVLGDDVPESPAAPSEEETPPAPGDEVDTEPDPTSSEDPAGGGGRDGGASERVQRLQSPSAPGDGSDGDEQFKPAQGGDQYLPSEPPAAPSGDGSTPPPAPAPTGSSTGTAPPTPEVSTETGTTPTVPQTQSSTSGLPVTGLAVGPVALAGLGLLVLGALGLRGTSSRPGDRRSRRRKRLPAR